MNYLKIYNQIIEKRKYKIPEGYIEKHHIIPRSLGGTNRISNLVRLTAREHFICHLLLVKIYEKELYAWKKMINAIMMMKGNPCKSNNTRYINSRLYEILKDRYSLIVSERSKGTNNHNYSKIWISNPILKITKFIKTEELDNYLKNGWIQKRIINWESYNKKIIKLKINQEEKKLKILKRQQRLSQLKKEKEQRLINKQCKFKKLSNLYNQYYKEYQIYGWRIFKKNHNYPYSKQNLITHFRRYVVDFKPQSGKKRGIKGLRE